MLILRIRRAESALADGRLDEAFEIAQSQDVRAHARGQKLIGQLVRSLVERGRSLLNEERLQQALADCEKAAQLGGNLPDICALRSGILAGLGGHQEQARRQDKALDLGRQHAAKGQLSVAARLVADAAVDHAPARSLLHDVEARRVAAEAALHRAEAALSRHDWPGAVEALLEARGHHAASQKLAEVSDAVTAAILEQIRKAADAGRLDLASVLLDRLRPVAPEAVSIQEWSGVLDHCRAAGQAVEAGAFRRAAEILRKLKATGSGMNWLEQALQDADQAARAAESLASGPLGWLTGQAAPAGEDRTVLLPEVAHGRDAPATLDRRDAGATPHARAGADSALPARLLFHVDAVGSFLVLREPVIRIGPSRSSRACDVPLAADPALPMVTIERTEDDYFLSCERAVRVNDVAVRRKLLAGGDQIALSPRCRIKFELPHPASTTAVLTVSGTRLSGSDARRAILMDHAMVMGPGPHAHVRAEALKEPVVLVSSENRLMCRTGEPVMVDDRPMDRVRGLALRAKICVGAVQFVVKAAS